MKKQKTWKVLNNSQLNPKEQIEKIIGIILDNRELKEKKEVSEFLHPALESVTIASVGIDKKQLEKTLTRIAKAIEKKEKIAIFGDYDVDGITGTAILWETLHKLSASVIPYIPHRVDEGYGLSVKGIENLLLQHPETKLIITVDNGIVANEAVDFAKAQKIEVIITDHHTIGKKLPAAFAIVHTTKLCGAGVAWMLSQQIKGISDIEHLDLVALATVADLVPLTGANRALLTAGLPVLQNTKRVGLKELFSEAGLDPKKIGVYEIGHVIGPRLNAMGRMESAMDSLRLLCTTNTARARALAATLGITNKERQLVTQTAALHAIEYVNSRSTVKNLLFVSHTYEEGVIGLVAGKLVEEFYRPSIVLSIGEKVSKASARSVAGFNIIDFIRAAQEHLINAGGHPMAAGFTVETEKIAVLQETLEKLAEKILTQEHLTPILKIDVEIPLSLVSQNLYDALEQLSPFGMGNPEPVFMTQQVEIVDAQLLGRDKKHIKFYLSQEKVQPIEAIAFGIGERFAEFKKGSSVKVAYTIDENEWNGRKKLQLKVKDIAKI